MTKIKTILPKSDTNVISSSRRVINLGMRDLYLYFKLYPRLFNSRMIKNGVNYLWSQRTKFPVSINFLITSKCNFKCKMCSFFDTRQSEISEISGEEIIKFVRAVSLYKPVIHLGGGEPFMRRDIYEIMAEIKSWRMPLLITTNGYLLEVDKIKKLNLDYIIFSLYGPREVHNKITGINDAYQSAVEKIKALPKERIIVSTIVMPENIDYLDEFIKKIIGCGVNKIKIENLNYITPQEYKNHDIKVNNYILKPTTLIRDDFPYPEIEKFWNTIEKLKIRYNGKIFLKPYLNKKEFFNWYLGKRKKTSCNFIFHSIFINSNGDIIPCQFLGNCSLGNITRDELEYIWQSQNFDRLRELINRLNLPVCKRCCK